MRERRRARLALVLAVGLVAALMPLSSAVADGPVYINEISVSTSGSDWEYVEIQGAPGTDLSGYTLLEIESDYSTSNTSEGKIDHAIALSGSIPADGYWVAMNSTAEATFGITGDASLYSNAFENSTATYLLVTGFSGARYDDLDTNDDGVLDSTPWTSIADSLNLRDSGANDFDYGAVRVGPDGSFLPAGAYRCPNAPTGSFDSNFLSYSTPDGTPGTENCPVILPVEKYISEVQGAGSSTPLMGVDVIVEGIVVGDFQGNAFAGWQLGGFFLQEEDGDHDADPLTSEGIFVYAPSAPDLVPGDVVQVTGTATEYQDQTQITDVTDLLVSGSVAVPAPVALSLPVADPEDWESVEGMLVTMPQDLYISEYYNFGRYGEIVVTTSRQYQPTQVYAPGSVEAVQLAEDNALSRITIDDGRSGSNPDPAIHPNGAEFTLTNTFRGGDILQDVTGIMGQRYSTYKIQPTAGATYINANPRPTSPDRIKGQLRVASFNVLNFFTTLDDGVNDVCGPTGESECRGADTAEEYRRQLDKLVAGIIALDADIVGLQEIENDIYDDWNRAHDPVLTLVEELNAVEGAGTWAWVGEPMYEGAAYFNDYPVRNDIIYRVSAVTPVGDAQTIESPAFDMTRDRFPGDIEPVGRPPVAQTFTTDDDNSDQGNRRAFTVVVNHFKSKGSACDTIEPPSPSDGQGNCNLTRVAQSEALLDFVADLQEMSGDEDVLIIGDLNSYAMEDPITTLATGGFTDLIQSFNGPEAYGYLFDGQLGTLDHALASPTLLAQVRGVTEFHINADEPSLLDYDMSYKKPAQDALYEPLSYRASDHDPVVVGIKLVRQDH